MSLLRSKLCLLHISLQYPLILARTNSTLNKQNIYHAQTIKDQALHESICDQTGSFPCSGPITDLHSTKPCSLFSCHFHWVEGHSASSIKWLGPFTGLKRTKLSLLQCHGLIIKIAEGKGGEGMKREGRRW